MRFFKTLDNVNLLRLIAIQIISNAPEQRKIAIYFNKKWTKSQLQKTFAIRLYIYEPIVETYILKSTQHANLKGWQSDIRVFFTCYFTD